MKSIYIFLIILAMITISCSDERIVLEKSPFDEEAIGGLVFVWSISQKSTDDYINIEVGSYFFEGIRDRSVRKIYLRKEMSGEFSSSSAEISKEDWDRIENLVRRLFPANPFELHDIHCDCCDETLSFNETLYFIHGIYECIIESKRIEGCTDKDIELVREFFQELKDYYFPRENMY